MLRFTSLMMGALILLTAVGCGDTHDKVMGDLLNTFESMNAELAEVKDAESAKAHSDEIAALAEQWEAIAARADKLDQPTKAEADALEEKYKVRIEEVMMEFLAQTMRVALLGEEVSSALQEAFEKVDKRDQQFPDWFE